MILTDTTRYIFPPRSSDAIPFNQAKELFTTLGWVAQLKYNDTRILLKYLPNKIEIWNRHGEKLRSYNTPNWLLEQLESLRQPLNITDYTIIDGGLLDMKHVAIKDTFAIWDILVLNGDHKISTTYKSRYDFLRGNLTTKERWMFKEYDIGLKISDNILIPENYECNKWDHLWDTIQLANAPYTSGTIGTKNYSCHPILEGLVFKSLTGTLEHGWKMKNNSSWMCRSRVTTGRHAF